VTRLLHSSAQLYWDVDLGRINLNSPWCSAGPGFASNTGVVRMRRRARTLAVGLNTPVLRSGAAMARGDNDTWDPAVSVGATATTHPSSKIRSLSHSSVLWVSTSLLGWPRENSTSKRSVEA
jgi:hypothetical protein